MIDEELDHELHVFATTFRRIRRECEGCNRGLYLEHVQQRSKSIILLDGDREVVAVVSRQALAVRFGDMPLQEVIVRLCSAASWCYSCQGELLDGEDVVCTPCQARQYADLRKLLGEFR